MLRHLDLTCITYLAAIQQISPKYTTPGKCPQTRTSTLDIERLCIVSHELLSIKILMNQQE